nr:hypothetical protein [Tanacetum cinerariifolium]
MTTSVESNSVFRSFFEKQKLIGPNFIDWYRQLRLVLSTEDKENYLEHHILSALVAPPGKQVPLQALAAHAAWVKGKKEELKAMYFKQAEQELLQTVREFHTSKQEEGQSVSSHVLKMKGYIDSLERLSQLVEKNLAGLRGSKKLKPGALSLYVGDGHRATVEAIGTYHLELPSGLVVVLNNFHYALSITRDSYLLWHCSLGYISKKRIEKLQHDRLLNSIDIELLGKCVSCMSGNMARKPYSHQVKRAKDLLGLIHTDVCGPFKIVSRQGASYFVTFTDDFSRYCYVYLLKHKHEVFETFKVFQKEVENQLVKTIKSLLSDRGGEYMSQEFLDHLKEHGIIAHHTPPYTPQNNRVSERRNRTLLDMVRSMMSQTALPKSFWDYALETAPRILNMVPTKKVEKTPYEIWHGQAPKIPSKNKVFVARNAEFFGSKLLVLKESGNNDVWVLVELPPNAGTVGSKWLFKKKTDMDGAVYIFKARLVAKGFTQTYVVDYKETFSPVADIRAIRILIPIAAYYDYEIWRMDVKTAFLNGHLSEEVYMEQPEASGSYIAILILYVDDILLMGNNIPMLQDIKSYLGRSFVMKDLGEAAYILGIKIYRDRTISMQEKLKLNKSQGASTPAEKQRMQNIPYASAVGSIMYAVRCTRPDVAFAQNMTSRNMERELRVFCYTDAEYLTDVDNLKSQTGYVFVLNGCAVDWKSTKQSIFATSSTDAEYIAAFDASKKDVWIRKFISGLGIVPTIEEPISDVKIKKIETDDNLSDPFTKALAFPKKRIKVANDDHEGEGGLADPKRMSYGSSSGSLYQVNLLETLHKGRHR